MINEPTIPTMPTNLESVTTYVESEVKKKLEVWAKEEDRSISYLVARLINQAVQQRDQQQPQKNNE